MVSGWVGLPPGTGAAGQVLHWIEFSSFLPGLASGARDALSSCNLLVRKADLLACGGFDEGMEMAEDLMLCRKIGRHGGGRLYFEGSTGVWHSNDATWDGACAHLRRLGFWSGRFRTLEAVPGSWLRHFPALSLALPLWRLPRILGRLLLINNMVWWRALARLPRLAAGLAVWAGDSIGESGLPPAARMPPFLDPLGVEGDDGESGSVSERKSPVTLELMAIIAATITLGGLILTQCRDDPAWRSASALWQQRP